MTEKDNVSMSTVQMKPEYAASEVYSTTSEAPPAYKRQSNSVKIAKITAFTVITASFILGAFVLASAYLSAKASCDQVQALDSVLEKELMLETLQQVSKDAPRAEALWGKDDKLSDDNDLQDFDLGDDPTFDKKLLGKSKQKDTSEDEITTKTNSNNNDNNLYAESDNDDEKFQSKVPLELDMSDLAAALLQNNKKSRMNCVVERKHAEEIVDSPSKTVALPFGVNLTTDPKKARITGERISIYCEGGNENREQESLNGRNNNNNNMNNNREDDEDNDIESEIESMRPMFVPYQRIPIPFGQVMQQYPLTHMPQRMLPPIPQQQQQQAQIVRQLPSPFQQQQQFRPPQRMMPPQQMMQAPRPDLPQQIQHHMMMMQELPQQLPLNQYQQQQPQQQMQQSQQPQQQQQQQQQTVRIRVQEMPFHEIHMADDVPVQIPTQHQELPHFQIQRLPLGLALQRAGITAEDLRNIQRIAEDRITDELRHLGAEEASESTEKNNVSGEDENDGSNSDSDEQQQRPAQQQDQQIPPVQSEQAKARPMAIQRLILQQLPEQPRDTMSPPMPNDAQAQPMMYGRANFGRSLVQPVRIPVPMMQPQVAVDEDSAAVASEAERPHFVQPRSV